MRLEKGSNRKGSQRQSVAEAESRKQIAGLRTRSFLRFAWRFWEGMRKIAAGVLRPPFALKLFLQKFIRARKFTSASARKFPKTNSTPPHPTAFNFSHPLPKTLFVTFACSRGLSQDSTSSIYGHHHLPPSFW